ncbi:Ger(x)C family spore germination C-terminal domain-containing protein [Bacillus haynesii]|uniref:Ger(X)C family spore germination C-terminal domain-containing protein n=1 Tax=Bacillus haynesii TaxID=1925021 RepID=A0AA90IXE6_9BACI|nr:Ger(x)C family spore germination C-terminal domain-containing protein [Bacillus haynesii]MCY9223702.1 Ger(x)C family spore germination C-terminal domain-containing protein [Bacillus haynesii]MCY9280374.1 Ger(x)C family spore germination C-terminal domain-containing protein [Bacillus haynesii]MCY9389981.1 Ger(x)C family spore germination C-terminal domain-containing protein [Bacillus haynesii]
MKEVERLAGDQVNVWIKSALGKLQSEYRTDVLKFGEKYRIQYPREWEKVKGKWDELFAEADITYDVDINIDNFGSSGRKR